MSSHDADAGSKQDRLAVYKEQWDSINRASGQLAAAVATLTVTLPGENAADPLIDSISNLIGCYDALLLQAALDPDRFGEFIVIKKNGLLRKANGGRSASDAE